MHEGSGRQSGEWQVVVARALRVGERLVVFFSLLLWVSGIGCLYVFLSSVYFALLSFLLRLPVFFFSFYFFLG